MYRIEKNAAGQNEIVIDGFEGGTGQSPYSQMVTTPMGSMVNSGLADVRNMNIISIPGEAAVQFSTAQDSFSSFSGSVASADATADTITYSGETGTPVSGMAMVFAGGSLPAGITAGTQSATADTNVYWIGNVNTSAKTFKVYSDYTLSTLVNITGTGTGTFATINITIPRHYAVDNSASSTPTYYVADSSGRVWYRSANWIFTGNLTRANANGNGLSYYRGYIFVYRNALIDYFKTSTGAWTYGWKTMNTAAGIANSHHALVGTDDTNYYCDASYLGSFFEVTGTTFDPTNAATYTWSSQALILLKTEIAQWLSELGSNLMITGQFNRLFSWDKTSTGTGFPIFLPEDFGYCNLSVAIPTYPKLVTVNTNTFIFCGNRGRIYTTNGVNAQLFAKLPDHLSGTIDPYYFWGAVGYNKNQLYFSAYVTKNDTSTAITAYGGLWALDVETKALRMTNKLSYGTYAGYATVFIPNPSTGSGGSFFVGWNSGASTYGMDSSSGTPYSNYESYIDSDMIPLGTYLTPYTPGQVEFKLTTPLVSGEGVKIAYRTNITAAFTDINSTTTVGALSDVYSTPFQNAQWVQLRVYTKSTSTTPSYTRLKEIRIR